MTGRLFELALVISLRAIPGVINLVTLLVLADKLSVKEFGIYSTLLVTYYLISSILYGPIQFSILSQYSKMEVANEKNVYETTLIFSAALISLFLILVVIVCWLFEHGVSLAVYIVISFGLFQVLQEVLRVQLRQFSYAVTAMAQSLFFFVLVYYFLEKSSTYQDAHTVLGASYCVGIVVSLVLLQPKWVRPKFGLLNGVFSIGIPYTASTLAENVILLGFRYVIMFSGTHTQLGIFSFCIDFAQRTVGFMVSVVGFIYVPRAFRRSEVENVSRFYEELRAGALLAVLTTICTVTFVTAAVSNLHIGAEKFNLMTYLFVASAILCNRVKKILVDPVLMRFTKVRLVSYGYICGALVSVPLGFLALTYQLLWGLEAAYLLGYVFSTVVSALLFSTRVPTLKKC